MLSYYRDFAKSKMTIGQYQVYKHLEILYRYMWTSGPNFMALLNSDVHAYNHFFSASRVSAYFLH